MTERDFTSFWDRNAASFEHFARVMARRNEYVAEEAYSHAFIHVWNRFQNEPLSEENEDFMRAYAFTCVRTHVMKWYRDTQRRNKRFVSGLGREAMSVAAASPALNPENVLELIDKKLAELPPKLEAAVRVCCLTLPPLAPADAAAALGCSVAEMYRRLRSARKALGETLGDLGFGYAG
jgi:DNA-directed RNA polymerase specialized sigma24 family protein